MSIKLQATTGFGFEKINVIRWQNQKLVYDV